MRQAPLRTLGKKHRACHQNLRTQHVALPPRAVAGSTGTGILAQGLAHPEARLSKCGFCHITCYSSVLSLGTENFKSQRWKRFLHTHPSGPAAPRAPYLQCLSRSPLLPCYFVVSLRVLEKSSQWTASCLSPGQFPFSTPGPDSPFHR